MAKIGEGAVPAEACRCGGRFRWERVTEDEFERWLGVCDCGAMVAFLPDAPNCTPSDPLTTVLAGPGRSPRPASPPWIRLFRMSGAEPWNVAWRYWPADCPTCDGRVVFEASAHARPGVLARCLLCLACGFTSVEHLRRGSGLRELPLRGVDWSPPCPAVLRLREALLRLECP